MTSIREMIWGEETPETMSKVNPVIITIQEVTLMKGIEGIITLDINSNKIIKIFD